jgi:shikimate dehydrogenase
MHRYGLIGYPLSHSFSPAYFAEKFQRDGLTEYVYEAYPISSIDQFPTLLQQHADLQGLNVTIPYKKAVIPFLHATTEAVTKMAACNCIKIENGHLTGHNTDVTGFEKSLLPLLSAKHTKALILGTGGAAAAVEFVLEKLGIDFLFVSRTQSEERGVIQYKDLSENTMSDYTLIVNTTPLGMYPEVDNCPDLPYEFITPDHYLFDLVYNPAETLFLKKGAERGAAIKNGSDMLIIQAEESWRIWNEG